MSLKLSESIKSPIVIIGLIVNAPSTLVQLILLICLYLLENPFYIVFTWIIKNHFLQQYSYHKLLGIDCYLNSIMLGDPNETCSSRAGRLWPNSWWCKFINCIMWFQKNHCQTHIEEFAGKTDLIAPDPTKII